MSENALLEALQAIRDDAEQIVLFDGKELPDDVYTLTRRIYATAAKTLKEFGRA